MQPKGEANLSTVLNYGITSPSPLFRSFSETNQHVQDLTFITFNIIKVILKTLFPIL